MSDIPFAEAEKIDPATATDEQLEAAWRSYASKISYHHADDSTKEWHLAAAIEPRARELEAAMQERGMARPKGDYLMRRIAWPKATGQ